MEKKFVKAAGIILMEGMKVIGNKYQILEVCLIAQITLLCIS